ncbi:hypothetical protein Plhal304r1_c014g0052301 [Plasmopara halstedii]
MKDKEVSMHLKRVSEGALPQQPTKTTPMTEETLPQKIAPPENLQKGVEPETNLAITSPSAETLAPDKHRTRAVLPKKEETTVDNNKISSDPAPMSPSVHKPATETLARLKHGSIGISSMTPKKEQKSELNLMPMTYLIKPKVPHIKKAHHPTTSKNVQDDGLINQVFGYLTKIFDLFKPSESEITPSKRPKVKDMEDIHPMKKDTLANLQPGSEDTISQKRTMSKHAKESVKPLMRVTAKKPSESSKVEPEKKPLSHEKNGLEATLLTPFESKKGGGTKSVNKNSLTRKVWLDSVKTIENTPRYVVQLPNYDVKNLEYFDTLKALKNPRSMLEWLRNWSLEKRLPAYIAACEETANERGYLDIYGIEALLDDGKITSAKNLAYIFRMYLQSGDNVKLAMAPRIEKAMIEWMLKNNQDPVIVSYALGGSHFTKVHPAHRNAFDWFEKNYRKDISVPRKKI